MECLKAMYADQHRPVEELSETAQQLYNLIRQSPANNKELRELAYLTGKSNNYRFDRALLDLQIAFNIGYGSLLPQVLEQNLGVPSADVTAVMQVIHNALSCNLSHPAMPIQDAIDLAEFLVDTTIRFVRFNTGENSVGGPIEIAAITKHEDFKWVKRKFYYKRELNP